MKRPVVSSTDVVTLGLAHDVSTFTFMPRAHRHTEVELNFVESGALTYLFGSERVQVTTEQIALFWASIPHQVIQSEPLTRFHWLTIPFATFLQWQLAEQLTQQIIRGKFVLIPLPTSSNTQRLFIQWHHDLQEQSSEYHIIVQLEIEAYLRRLMVQREVLAEEEVAQPKGAHIQNKAEQMACYIAEHYTEIRRIEEVAQVAHLHTSYAMSLFSKHFGVSMGDYITQYRVSHAQRLLITTSATTSAIALEAGFGSVSRFYSAFKETCGQSPGDYRQRIQHLAL